MIVSGIIQAGSPQMRAIQDEVRDLMRIALLRVARHDADPVRFSLPIEPDSIEQTLLKLVRAAKVRRPDQVARLTSRAMLLRADNPLAVANLRGLDLEGPSIARQLHARKLVNAVTVLPEMQVMKQVQTFESFYRWLDAAKIARGSGLDDAEAAPVVPPPAGRRIAFKIDSIRCIDKQEPFFFEDEILTGGLGLDTSSARITKVPQFRLRSKRAGGTFRSGTSRNFKPDVRFVEFAMKPGPYPRVFSANVLLFEKDGEGIAAILQALWEAVGEELTTIVASVAGGLAGIAVGAVVGSTELGAAVGSAVPGLGTLVGALAGVVAGLVLGAIIVAIIEVFRDDVLGDLDEPIITFAALESITSRFAGGALRGETEMLEFRNRDARYQLRGYWEISV